MKKKQLKQIVVTLCLLMGICSQVKADDFVTTITDGYYYIRTVWDMKQLSYQTQNGVDYAYKADYVAPEASSLDLKRVWYVKKTGENTYSIQNMKTKKYLGQWGETFNPTGGGSFALQEASYNTYIFLIANSPNTNDSGWQGVDRFVMFSDAAYQYEYSGRWTGADGNGYLIHVAYADNAAHPVSFQPIDDVYNEYLNNAKLVDLIAECGSYKTAADAEKYRTNLQGTERGTITITAANKAALQAQIAAAQELINSGTATATQLDEAYNNLKAVKDICDAGDPIVDGYYYIVAAFDGLPLSYKTVDSADYAYKTNWSDPSTSLDMASVFKVTKTGDNAFTIQNMKTGKYLGAYNTVHNPSDKGSFALQTESYTTYVLPWRSSHNSGTSYGEVTDAIDFCLFSEAALEHEYSGRWTGNGWNIHSDLGDIVAHAWRFLPVDDAYNAYLAEKDFNDLIAAADEALTTPTPADHHDNGGEHSFLLGNEKTSIDGLATSKDAKDALQVARDAVYNGYKTDGKTLAQLSAEIATLNAAMATVNAKSNPLVDGYYYIVAEVNNNTAGVPGGWVMRYSGNNKKVGKAHYDANDTKQFFKVTYDEANGKITLQNVASGLYVGVVDGNQWYFTSEATTLNVKTGSPFNWYHSAETTRAARSCSFVLYNDNNKCIYNSAENSTTYGDASNNGTYGWLISWAFRPVADELIPTTPVILNINNGVATSNVDEPFTAAQIQACLANDDYEYTAIDLSGITLASGVSAADIVALQTGNILVYLPTSATFTGTNMVKDGVCSQLILTDGYPFTAPTPFTATSATYDRTMTNEWGTICLPYAVSSDANTEYYDITAIENNTLVVTKVDNLAAGTPALVHKVSGDAITSTATNVPVTATIVAPGGSVQMTGVYEKTKVEDANAYYIKDNKFWQCNNNFYCGAFRAYFTTSSAPSSAFDILITDDDPTAIASAANEGVAAIAIYSVDGKKLATLQKGVNIVKLANGKTQKVVVK